MQKIIGVTELQRRFKSVLDEVAEKQVPYVLLRGSRPRAALMPYEAFLRLQKLEEKEVPSRFQRLRARMARASADVSDEDVATEVAAARAELED